MPSHDIPRVRLPAAYLPPRQFDWWLWLYTTTAVYPLLAPPATPPAGDMPDTCPFGL